MSNVDKRVECLDKAKGCVTSDRATSYGQPEDNFSAIANIWNAQGVSIDGRSIQAHDVALMMAGMKLARLRTNPGHEDSWVDIAGYAACGMHVINVVDASAQASNVSNMLPLPVMPAWKNSDKRSAQDGWVGPNQCGISKHHPAHSYGYEGNKIIRGAVFGGYWCDGFIESDIDVVKRVADRDKMHNSGYPGD